MGGETGSAGLSLCASTARRNEIGGRTFRPLTRTVGGATFSSLGRGQPRDTRRAVSRAGVTVAGEGAPRRDATADVRVGASRALLPAPRPAGGRERKARSRLRDAAAPGR